MAVSNHGSQAQPASMRHMSPVQSDPSSQTDRVTVAVIDSGVHEQHPHVNGVAGGIAFDAGGRSSTDYADRLGHGTAVAAVIREKAPLALVYAVRIFERQLAVSSTALLAALDWAIDAEVQIVNLSLGTSNQAHAEALRARVNRARVKGIAIVAARDDGGVLWLPGCLPGVVPVQVDWECPRDCYRIVPGEDGVVIRASGFPRPIPGVDPRRNLNGVSFAVANVTGCLAAIRTSHGGGTVRTSPTDELARALTEGRFSS